MSTALTVYMANAVSTTLSSANKLYSIAGTPGSNQSYTTIGNNVTGFGEICSQGASSGWAAGGSIGNPTGKGFLFDVTTLEGQQFLAGNWTPTIRLNAAQGPGNPQSGTLVGDIIMRAFRRSSSGIYTQIISSTLTAQTLNSTFTTYSLPAASGVVMNFGPGDKLYIDAWFNCTTNANSNNNQGIRLNRLSNDVAGLTGDVAAQMVTPGYQPGGPGAPGVPPPPPATFSAENLSVYKTQTVLVFDPTGTQFIDVWADAPLLAGFKETMNAATTLMQVELPRPFDNFDLAGSTGARGTIGRGNIVQYWLYGPGIPSTGLLRFAGYIDGYAPQIKEDGSESVVVTLTPLSAALGDRALAGIQSFGTPNQPVTYTDPVTMFNWFFQNNDPNTGKPYAYPLSLSSGNPTSSNVLAQYGFQNQNLLSIFTTLLLMLPINWFHRTDPNGIVTLNVAPTTAQHTVDLAQHVVNPQYVQDWSQAKNIIYLTGQSQTSPTNPNIAIPLVSATAIGSDAATVGARYQFINDSRVVDQNTANVLAQGALNQLDRYTLRTKLRIPDYRGDIFGTVGYDIESLKVGDTIQLADTYGAPSSSSPQSVWDVAQWDGTLWDAAYSAVVSPVVQIISIDYNWYFVDVELGSLQPNQDLQLFGVQQRFLDFTMI